MCAFFQVALSCEFGCGEMEEFILPTSTITSITLQVEEMCQPGVTGIDELEIIGGFVESGKVEKKIIPYMINVFCNLACILSQPCLIKTNF